MQPQPTSVIKLCSAFLRRASSETGLLLPPLWGCPGAHLVSRAFAAQGAAQTNHQRSHDDTHPHATKQPQPLHPASPYSTQGSDRQPRQGVEQNGHASHNDTAQPQHAQGMQTPRLVSRKPPGAVHSPQIEELPPPTAADQLRHIVQRVLESTTEFTPPYAGVKQPHPHQGSSISFAQQGGAAHQSQHKAGAAVSSGHSTTPTAAASPSDTGGAAAQAPQPLAPNDQAQPPAASATPQDAPSAQHDSQMALQDAQPADVSPSPSPVSASMDHSPGVPAADSVQHGTTASTLGQPPTVQATTPAPIQAPAAQELPAVSSSPRLARRSTKQQHKGQPQAGTGGVVEALPDPTLWDTLAHGSARLKTPVVRSYQQLSLLVAPWVPGASPSLESATATYSFKALWGLVQAVPAGMLQQVSHALQHSLAVSNTAWQQAGQWVRQPAAALVERWHRWRRKPQPPSAATTEQQAATGQHAPSKSAARTEQAQETGAETSLHGAEAPHAAPQVSTPTAPLDSSRSTMSAAATVQATVQHPADSVGASTIPQAPAHQSAAVQPQQGVTSSSTPEPASGHAPSVHSVDQQRQHHEASRTSTTPQQAQASSTLSVAQGWAARLARRVQQDYAAAPKVQNLRGSSISLGIPQAVQQLQARFQSPPQADSAVPAPSAARALYSDLLGASSNKRVVNLMDGTQHVMQQHHQQHQQLQQHHQHQQVQHQQHQQQPPPQPAASVPLSSPVVDAYAALVSARLQQLQSEQEEIRAHMAALKAEWDAARLPAADTSTLADQAPAGLGPPRITLDTPIFRLQAQMQDASVRLSHVQEELGWLHSGTWVPPPEELTQHQPHSSSPEQLSRPGVVTEQHLADVLMDALRPDTSAQPRSSSRAAHTSQYSQANASYGADDNWDMPTPDRPWRQRQTQSTTTTPGPAAGGELPSWVNEYFAGSAPTAADSAELSSMAAAEEGEYLTAEEESHLASQPERPTAANLEPLEIPALVSVRALAELLGTRPSRLEAWLREVLAESPASVEDSVSADAAELAALEWGRTPIMTAWTAGHQDDVTRPPVVTIMGHVDHGKTSLLDALRHSSVAANEAGGITQHIGAFEVLLPGSPLPITFLDTPGHAAFSAMRARGAAVTDMVVLVVAADDGIMPQTREALSHARSANCPLVVALTKCDLPGARPAAVKQALLSEGVDLEEYGGTVQIVHTSAKTGLGLQDLTEALQLQAELMELKAGMEGAARAVVVEASQGKSGPQATVIVRDGRLAVGDSVVVGTEFGKVRALRFSSGAAAPAEGVGPGHHALVLGLRGLPVPGDEVKVVGSEEQAKRISAARAARQDDYRRSQLVSNLHSQRSKEAEKTVEAVAARRAAREARLSAAARRRSATAAHLEQLAAEHRANEPTADPAAPHTPGDSSSSIPPTPAAGGDASEAPPDPSVVEEVRLVVKADVQGSVEAVNALVQQLASPYVNIKVLHAGVGPLTLGDINLAVAANAHIVTFNLGGGVRAGSNGQAVEAALQAARAVHNITLVSHNIVYHLMDELRALVKGATPYIEVEEVVGEGEVQASFALSGKKASAAGLAGRIAGVRVTQGTMTRDSSCVRVIRGGVVVHQGSISSLRRHKLDVDVVGSGTDCGLVLDGGHWSDWQPGDTLQCVSRVRRRAGDTAQAKQAGQQQG